MSAYENNGERENNLNGEREEPARVALQNDWIALALRKERERGKGK